VPSAYEEPQNQVASESLQKGSPVRRVARIVQAHGVEVDDVARRRRRLLERLLLSESRGAITRAAAEFAEAGFEFPDEQEVQLQLLAHFDENVVRAALEKLSGLLATQVPIKRPVLVQRLRRIEDSADDLALRDRAAEVRRALRD
jgi:hypothetical protein